MKYDVSDFDVIWRKGDGEMPDKAKHVVNAAKREKDKSVIQDFVDTSMSSTGFWDNPNDEVWDNYYNTNPDMIKEV